MPGGRCLRFKVAMSESTLRRHHVIRILRRRQARQPSPSSPRAARAKVPGSGTPSVATVMPAAVAPPNDARSSLDSASPPL